MSNFKSSRNDYCGTIGSTLNTSDKIFKIFEINYFILFSEGTENKPRE